MKKVFLILWLLVLVSVQVQAQQPTTIHWLLFVDTKDSNVGDLDKNGLDYLRQHFVAPVNAVLENAGMRSDVQIFDGDRLSPRNCTDAIQRLSCTPKDIVVFYYMGHGGRSIGENDREHPWPQMWLGQNSPNDMLDLKWVHDQLKSKNPNLLLTIGMCCNVKQNLPLAHAPNFYRTFGMNNKTFGTMEDDAIKKLFLQSRGDVIATSASPGESSVGGDALVSVGVPPMDYYTPLFCLLFNDELSSNPNISWDGFFTKLSRYFTNDLSDLHMTPIHRANITITAPVVIDRDTLRNPPPSPIFDPAHRYEALTSLETILEYVRTSHDDSRALPVFTDDALVKIIAQDGMTVVHRKNIRDYLLVLATNKRLLLATPVDCQFQGNKCSEVHIMEYYQL